MGKNKEKKGIHQQEEESKPISSSSLSCSSAKAETEDPPKLLSLFDPGPPPKKKKKKKREKSSKLAKLLQKLAPKGKAKESAKRRDKLKEEMGEMIEEKAEETWTKEKENEEQQKQQQSLGGLMMHKNGEGGGLVEWTLGAFEDENEEEKKKKEEEEMNASGMMIMGMARKRSISTSNLHGKEANEGKEEKELEMLRGQKMGSRAQSAELHKNEQKLEEKEGQKKRKKSFKICQCIPRANTFEEINLPKKIVNQLHPQKMAHNSAGSRFKITPVQNRYKRGRWEVWDYYEGADLKKSIFLQKWKQQPKDDQQHCFIPPYSPPSSLEKEENQKNNQQFGRNSLSPPAAAAQIGHWQTPPQAGSQQPQLPRRNSFQLITIRNLENRRFSSSVPTSISEEKLNLPCADQKQESAPPLSRAIMVAPQIVEPEIAHQIDERQQQVEEQFHSTTTNNIGSTIQHHQKHLSPPSNSHAPNPNPNQQQQQQQPSQLQMIQQFGLEHSLSLGLEPLPPSINQRGHPSPPQPQQQYFSASFGPGQIQFNQQKIQLEEKKAATLARRNSSASTGAAPSSAGVAIDSKIEQAMDLVKTHLIYAVRDEIELLRSRIIELETTVIQLEAENSILRENIPNEVLASLCLDPLPAKPKPIAFVNNSATATIAQ